MQEMQETWVWSLDWKDPLEKEMELILLFLLGKYHEQRSLAGCSPQGHKRVGEDLTTKQQQKIIAYFA